MGGGCRTSPMEPAHAEGDGPDLDFKYTLCFVIDRAAEAVLMLLRARPPFAGRWNGVGGKMEPGESPCRAVLREVAEETGLHLPDVRFGGVLTWSGFAEAGGSGGLYLYVADVPPGVDPGMLPRETPEGRLAWLPMAEVLRPVTEPVVDNLPHILPHVLSGAGALWHYHCTYAGHRLVAVAVRPLAAEVAAAAMRV
jgi:8-oxo-dGTP diphosphatase